MSDYIIKAEHISKTLKGKKVLDDITAYFERGKVYGVVGANASGKTMLFRALAGLIHLDSGSVEKFPPQCNVGVIVENPGFLLSYTGFVNLQFLASIRRQISDQQIVEAMNDVGLSASDKRKVKAYSLGMKQKLAIAQAIMERPEILILDEPTRGLDQESVTSIRKLLLKLNKEGATILISSHNPEDISVLSDQIYTMEKGRLIAPV